MPRKRGYVPSTPVVTGACNSNAILRPEGRLSEDLSELRSVGAKRRTYDMAKVRRVQIPAAP